MYKDIWNLTFFLIHVTVIGWFMTKFGPIGFFSAALMIFVFWKIKGFVAADLELWATKKEGDVKWPRPLAIFSVGLSNILGRIIGLIFMIGMGLGILMSLGSLTHCSSADDGYEYEPRAR